RALAPDAQRAAGHRVLGRRALVSRPDLPRPAAAGRVRPGALPPASPAGAARGVAALHRPAVPGLRPGSARADGLVRARALVAAAAAPPPAAGHGAPMI